MNQQSEAEMKMQASSSPKEVKPSEEEMAFGGVVSVEPIEKGCNPLNST